jgi:hypothetical protein
VIVPAGTAVVLNQSLIHYSPPNRSNKIRKAITSGVKTKDAQMIFHFKDPESTSDLIEKFEMDDDFFIHFEDFFKDIYKRPMVGKSVGMVSYTVPMLSGEDLTNTLRKMKEDAGFEFLESEPLQIEETQTVLESVEVSQPWVDDRSFWETYTPGNIYRELMSRFNN